MRFESKEVWVGLVNREIDLKKRSFKKQKLDLDEVRTFLLQDLWYAQGIEKYGFIRGADTSPILEPKNILDGIYYLTDGYRLVLWISREPIALNKVTAMDWEIPPQR